VTARLPLLLVAVAAGSAAGSPQRRIECFSATAASTSSQARARFAARHCQGGGVTWAPILEALARRHARVVAVDEATPGWTGAVFTDGKMRFSVDDEADAARFCSDDGKLLAAVRRDYATVNANAEELRRVMAQASALEMECSSTDGSAPPLPKMNPVPTLPAREVTATREKLERLKKTIARQPAWCFPPDDFEDRKGVLRFAADGTATLSGGDGKVVQRGVWQLPPPERGDSRVEVVMKPAGMLLHLDVGPTGRLGADYLDPGKTIRQELIPGDECLRTR
jgi:hypothetical protein